MHFFLVDKVLMFLDSTWNVFRGFGFMRLSPQCSLLVSTERVVWKCLGVVLGVDAGIMLVTLPKIGMWLCVLVGWGI